MVPRADFADPEPLDAESVLPLASIRAHTKTDDVVSVPDAQLELHRSAAIEAAEQFTGLAIRARRRITERVGLPLPPATSFGPRRQRDHVHRLKGGSADGVVYAFGSEGARLDQIVPVPIGATEVRLPASLFGLTLDRCCDPCGGSGGVLTVSYVVGFRSAGDIPAGVRLGMLKFIAWSIENPGDVMRTVDGATGRTDGVLQGSNSVALASGALEMWRQYRGLR